MDISRLIALQSAVGGMALSVIGGRYEGAMRMIRPIARVGATTSTAQDAPGAAIVTAVDLEGLLSFQRRAPHSRCSCLAAMVALYFMFYNSDRVHQTLRVTPAMEAGSQTMSGRSMKSSASSKSGAGVPVVDPAAKA